MPWLSALGLATTAIIFLYWLPFRQNSFLCTSRITAYYSVGIFLCDRRVTFTFFLWTHHDNIGGNKWGLNIILLQGLVGREELTLVIGARSNASLLPFLRVF